MKARLPPESCSTDQMKSSPSCTSIRPLHLSLKRCLVKSEDALESVTGPYSLCRLMRMAALGSGSVVTNQSVMGVADMVVPPGL